MAVSASAAQAEHVPDVDDLGLAAQERQRSRRSIRPAVARNAACHQTSARRCARPASWCGALPLAKLQVPLRAIAALDADRLALVVAFALHRPGRHRALRSIHPPPPRAASRPPDNGHRHVRLVDETAPCWHRLRPAPHRPWHSRRTLHLPAHAVARRHARPSPGPPARRPPPASSSHSGPSPARPCPAPPARPAPAPAGRDHSHWRPLSPGGEAGSPSRRVPRLHVARL